MRRTVCAVYLKLLEERLYYRKNKKIVHFYYEYVSQRYGEAKSTSI
jgi:hypothetical protein